MDPIQIQTSIRVRRGALRGVWRKVMLAALLLSGLAGGAAAQLPGRKPPATVPFIPSPVTVVNLRADPRLVCPDDHVTFGFEASRPVKARVMNGPTAIWEKTGVLTEQVDIPVSAFRGLRARQEVDVPRAKKPVARNVVFELVSRTATRSLAPAAAYRPDVERKDDVQTLQGSEGSEWGYYNPVTELVEVCEPQYTCAEECDPNWNCSYVCHEIDPKCKWEPRVVGQVWVPQTYYRHTLSFEYNGYEFNTKLRSFASRSLKATRVVNHEHGKLVVSSGAWAVDVDALQTANIPATRPADLKVSFVYAQRPVVVVKTIETSSSTVAPQEWGEPAVRFDDQFSGNGFSYLVGCVP